MLRTKRPLVHVGRYLLVLGLSFSFFLGALANETGGCDSNYIRRADLHHCAFGPVVEGDGRLASLGGDQYRVLRCAYHVAPPVSAFSSGRASW